MVTQTSDAKISIGWPSRIFSILNWREIDNFKQKKSQSAFRRPLWQMEKLWKMFCIQIIWQSHHAHYHFNTTSDKIYVTNKSTLWNINWLQHSSMAFLSLIWPCPLRTRRRIVACAIFTVWSHNTCMNRLEGDNGTVTKRPFYMLWRHALKMAPFSKNQGIWRILGLSVYPVEEIL
jgi:hypothetical protein